MSKYIKERDIFIVPIAYGALQWYHHVTTDDGLHLQCISDVDPETGMSEPCQHGYVGKWNLPLVVSKT